MSLATRIDIASRAEIPGAVQRARQALADGVPAYLLIQVGPVRALGFRVRRTAAGFGIASANHRFIGEHLTLERLLDAAVGSASTAFDSIEMDLANLRA